MKKSVPGYLLLNVRLKSEANPQFLDKMKAISLIVPKTKTKKN